jgi:hypothetical protein
VPITTYNYYMQRFSKVNKLLPESNQITKAILYAVGSWGVLHLCIMAVFALFKRDVRELNTLIAINIDRIIPAVKESYILFIISWIGLISTVYCCYILIKKSNR